MIVFRLKCVIKLNCKNGFDVGGGDDDYDDHK